jgi:hypothetical protein
MKQQRILIAALVLAVSTVSHLAQAQTTTGTTTTGTTTTGTTTTGTTTTGTTTGTTTSGTTQTPAPSRSEIRYVSRIASHYGDLAGSTENLQSLVHGLRTGSEVQLSGSSGSSGTSGTTTGSTTTTSTSGSGTSSVTFTPSTRPMGYGNITRVLSLASKQLAAAGVTNPTAQDLQAALNGGTVKTAQGSTTFQGILKLRSEGMGWGKIAHTIGVHPGMGKGAAHHTASTTTTGTQVSTASGTSHSSSADSHHGKGVVTASGATAASSGGKGIVTAGGTGHSTGGGSTPKAQSGAGVVTASGASAARGVTTASANSRGNGYGRGGKD